MNRNYSYISKTPYNSDSDYKQHILAALQSQIQNIITAQKKNSKLSDKFPELDDTLMSEIIDRFVNRCKNDHEWINLSGCLIREIISDIDEIANTKEQLLIINDISGCPDLKHKHCETIAVRIYTNYFDKDDFEHEFNEITLADENRFDDFEERLVKTLNYCNYKWEFVSHETSKAENIYVIYV